jgi:hypothetical protein
MPSSTLKRSFERQLETLIIELGLQEHHSIVLDILQDRSRYSPYSITPSHRLRTTLNRHILDDDLIDVLLDAYSVSQRHRYLYRGKTGRRRTVAEDGGPGLTEGDRKFEAEFG